MTSYGSLDNMLMNGANKEIIPEVGMGATELLWSDRHAHTIIAISESGKTLTIQRDRAIRVDKNGMSDSQEYRYERDPKGSISKARKNKHGVWKVLGSRTTLTIGVRREYYDYSF